jgi:flagellin-like hook-associated protein FlgL
MAMDDIVLSAGVRQNLLALQSTAHLMSLTQNRLATGKRVNTAEDNPISFFTSQSLHSRAGDFNSLLDSIGQAQQVLSTANQGITSLSKLVQSGISTARQAQQSPIGYTTKSNISTTIGGATALDLRGTTTYISVQAMSNVLSTGNAGGITPALPGTTLGGTAGSFTTGSVVQDNASTPVNITTATKLYGPAGGGAGTGGLTTQAATGFTDGSTFTVDGHTITFRTTAVPAAAAAPTGYGVSGNIATDGNGNSIVYLGTGTQSTASVGDLFNAIDLASGIQSATISGGTATITSNPGGSSITGGVVTLRSSTGADLSVTGKADALKALGLTTATGSGNATVTAPRTTGSASLGTLITDGSTLSVNGKTITFKNGGTPLAANVPTGSGVVTGSNVVTDGNGNSTVYLNSGTIADVLKAIDLATGVQTAAISSGAATLSTASGAVPSSIAPSGALQISTGTTSDLTISGSGNSLAALGLNGNTGNSPTFTASRAAAPGGISGTTLTFTSFNGGTPINLTFGDGTGGTIKTLDQLNAALQADNLTATLDTSGKLTISASNDYASSTLGGTAGGVLGGTVTSALIWTAPTAPVADGNALATRQSLQNDYVSLLSQIDQLAKDASFGGINLIYGDSLKIVFNENGSSALQVVGVTFTAAGLGLASPSVNAFQDNASINAVVSSLNNALVTLRTQASKFGSNLSVVQNRQDFTKNMINLLQTGADSLVLADSNEEGANMLALQTRQQLSTTALSLASQADQAVLRLFG